MGGLLTLYMEIRIARHEDLFNINMIYNQAVEQKFCTAHLEPVGMDYHEDWFREYNQDPFAIHVAIENSRVIGWSSLGPYRSGREALAHVVEVSYYVHNDARGRGVGSLLLQHAIEEAPRFGYSVLIAILLSKNNVSIGLLEKFGFACWGTMPGIALIGKNLADHLYYGLKLS